MVRYIYLFNVYKQGVFLRLCTGKMRPGHHRHRRGSTSIILYRNVGLEDRLYIMLILCMQTILSDELEI